MHEALILAAGRGERMQHQGLPKPLVPFLGLPLLARSMRTLARAGIDRVVVAVGHEADRVAEAAQRYGREAHLEVAIARAPDWERGNGASALAARELLQGPFLMVMCDHVFEPEMLQRLIKAPLPQDGLVLAVDRRLDNPLVDDDDVTRVRLDGERITAIGKGLERFDAWDAGAFACTPGVFEALSASDGSVSDAVRLLAREGKARALDIGEAFWADLDDAAAMRRARRAMLRRAAGKASDGPVSRWLNRPLSRLASGWLIERGITPLQVTWGAFALSLLAALWMAAPAWWALALGGVLAQAASIVDGCDGEIARLTMNESETGGWLDAVLDRYADAAMLAALMLHAIWHEHAGAWAAVAGVAALSGALINSYTADKYDGWMRRRGLAQRFRLGRDVRVLAIMAAALMDAPMALLWGMAVLMHAENARRIWLILGHEEATA